MKLAVHKSGLVALVGSEDPNLDNFEVDDDPRLHQGFTIHYKNGILTYEDSYQMTLDKQKADELDKATTVKSLKDYLQKYDELKSTSL